MAQTGRSNVRYVDPQRRYTVVLGPSWNAPFGALPHDDRAGIHDGADGQCGSYAPAGSGQAAMWITSKIFCRRLYPWKSGTTAAPPSSHRTRAVSWFFPKANNQGLRITRRVRASQKKRPFYVSKGEGPAVPRPRQQEKLARGAKPEE